MTKLILIRGGTIQILVNEETHKIADIKHHIDEKNQVDGGGIGKDVPKHKLRIHN